MPTLKGLKQEREERDLHLHIRSLKYVIMGSTHFEYTKIDFEHSILNEQHH